MFADLRPSRTYHFRMCVHTPAASVSLRQNGKKVVFQITEVRRYVDVFRLYAHPWSKHTSSPVTRKYQACIHTACCLTSFFRECCKRKTSSDKPALEIKNSFFFFLFCRFVLLLLQFYAECNNRAPTERENHHIRESFTSEWEHPRDNCIYVSQARDSSFLKVHTNGAGQPDSRARFAFFFNKRFMRSVCS